MTDVDFEVRWITPSEARRLLAVKRSNTPLRLAQVKQYAGEMRQGRWVLNGDPIIIGRSGALLSGVLRLEAARLADVGFPALLVRNIDDAAFETIDSVRRRTVGDILAIRREAHGRILAAALGILWRYSTGDYTKSSRAPAPQALLALLAEHPETRTSVGLTTGLANILPHGVAAALHYLFSRIDGEMASAFFLEMRAPEPKWPAVAALKRQLQHLADRGGTKRQSHLIGLTIKAWEAHRRGSDVKLLRFDPEADPAPYVSGLSREGFQAGLNLEGTDPIESLDHATSELQVESVEITPEMAERLLEANTLNRHVAGYVVDKYARDMSAGDWRLNGQTIKIGKSGRLLDGQHRLYAAVKSGESFPAIIVRGLEDRVFETFDLGARRSVSAILIDRGEINTSTLAAALRQLWLIENGFLTSKNATPTVAELLDVLARHPTIRESVRYAQKIKHITAPTLVVALHYFFAEKSPSLAEEFIERLADGANLRARHPILRLRDQLMQVRNERKNIQADPERAAWVIKAWNAFIEGREIAHIKWSTGGARPEAFPTIRSPQRLQAVA
jgi:hypothetical protein